MTQALLLLAVLTQATQAAGPGAPRPGSGADPLTPDTVFTVPGGPRIVRLATPGSPLVALRISIPIQESAAEAGAARLLQVLARNRAQAQAGQLAAQVDGTRTPWGVAYTVVGSRADFDFLVFLLREAVAEPQPSEVEFERQRLAQRAEVLRSQETAAGWMVARLRASTAPSLPPLEGTLGTLATMTRSALRDVWLRTHRPGSMTVVMTGDVPDELVLSAFQPLGAPAAPALPGSGARPRAGDGQRTQVLRHWYGEAYSTSDPRDPHPAVAALLIADRLRGANAEFESQVQLWEMAGRQVVAVVGAAYPAARERMRARLRAVLADARQGLSSERVEGAVARARHDLLLGARTPVGLVTLVGRHVDATGDPDGARLYLEALERVTLDSTRSFLTGLERQTPLRAELGP